jgi:hypothetical protein
MWMDKPIQITESDEEYKKKILDWRQSTYQTLPLKIEALNPYNVMQDPSYGEKGYVFETYTKMVFDAKKRYPKWSNPEGRKIDDNATYTIYFDKDYRCDLIDGEPVLPV